MKTESNAVDKYLAALFRALCAGDVAHGHGSGEGSKPLPGHRQLAPCFPSQMGLCHTVPQPQGSALRQGVCPTWGRRAGLDPRTSLCEASDYLEWLF